MVVAVKRLVDEADFRELRKEAASLLTLKVSSNLFFHFYFEKSILIFSRSIGIS
jgi:hypothetical protein